MTEDALRTAWRKRDNRCLREGKYFAKQKAGGIQWMVRRDALSPALEEILENPEKAWASDEILKGASMADWRRLGPAGLSTPLLVRRFQPCEKGPLGALKRLFVLDRTMRAWKTCNALLVRGIPALRPLAAGTQRSLGSAAQGFLVLEDNADARGLDEYLTSERRPERRQALILELASVLKRLHHLGFSFTKLHAAEILVQNGGKTGGRILLKPLHVCQTDRPVPDAEKILNLAALNASIPLRAGATSVERLRFLKEYLARESGHRSILKRYWGSIGARIHEADGPDVYEDEHSGRK
jgi:hypothetical protein